MKPVLKIATCILLSGALLYISCKKELSCENCGKGNRPPIAHAGKDTAIILPVDSVMLDGRASMDPENKITRYEWRKISGPVAFNIQDASAASTHVKNIISGSYEFELMVTDNAGLSARDTIRITVDSMLITNHPPIAIAAKDTAIILPANNITLDGSASSDPENNIASYLWTKISGPISFNITNANVMQTTVTNLIQGTYEFELMVSDAGGLFAKDTMQVTVNTTQTNPCTANRPLISAHLIPFGTLSGPKSDIAVGAAGNKIVFAGGYDGYDGVSTVDIYDIVSNVWSTAQLSAPRFGIAVTACGNKIFFGGGFNTDGSGFNLCNNVDIYDASTNTWSVDSLSSARSGLTAASVGNKVFFAGGTTPNYSVVFSNTIDIYDLTTNIWSTATLSEARGYLSAVTVGSRIYFAGGENGLGTFSNRIDIYDNATSSWSTSSLNEPKSRMTNIAFAGKIYWAGGINSLKADNSWNPSSHVEIKDVTAQVSSFACLFQPNFWRSLSSVNEKNNKLIFFTSGGEVINKFDIYDVATNTWSIGVLNQKLHSSSIISVNNTIYVAGGVSGTVGGSWSNQVWKLEF